MSIETESQSFLMKIGQIKKIIKQREKTMDSLIGIKGKLLIVNLFSKRKMWHHQMLFKATNDMKYKLLSEL